ncbi:riboflavin kinase/FMN adenylyltransferase [Paenibacillus shirakamiensis]|uniref:Riboflavin biosynthesis protein n=1 Tax=Paenibacillus shirakamiensis TaxID=1265935 RepID=A0ABS4JIX5_9BACL|nr:bifunctional riboflavin kinase/FAD synthetase [Paenibacillus shirakamiensis]MBP2001070.1 riboflavin kinase/FMN adenylyltransferase [Paenibacillus shirakamiensis]
MEIVNLAYPLDPDLLAPYAKPQVLALGQFDGLHLGHVSVIQAALDKGKTLHLPVAMMTFYPHPKEVMKKGDYDGYLTPSREKEIQLRSMGIDVLYIIEFNEEFSRVTPYQFVHEVLEPLMVHTAVVGFDFRFGHKGEGDAEMLRVLGNDQLHVLTIPPFLIEGEKVSSSGIRRHLLEGNLANASAWLGRHYTLIGIVVNGEKRGRQIGFPTANIQLDEYYALPIKGVYAVLATYADKVYKGVANLGVKPTFHSGDVKPSLEVHLFDFSGDLYGEMLQVELVSFIREERKFSGIDELITQIRKDAEEAVTLLNHLK